MQIRTIRLAALAASLLLTSPVLAQGSAAERLTVHGAVNAAWGKSDGLPTFGIDKDGTTNYRAIALQFGYQIDDNDRVVTQFLNRWNGTSPLNATEKGFAPVWAFYEHTFENGTKVKLGRNPLPRGLYNEVRFVGTLLPFYRVGRAVYGETLEQIDGVVVSRPFDLGDWRLETFGFAGGFDLRAVLAEASSVNVLQQRLENSVGGQVWLNTPVEGLRVGAYAHSYYYTPRLSRPDSLRSDGNLTWMASAEYARPRYFVRGEMTEFAQGGTRQYQGWYGQVGVKPVESLTLATEYQEATYRVALPAPVPAVDLPMTKELTIGAVWSRSANVAFKLEGHRVVGYDFDTAVPTIIPPTAPPFIAGIAPASKSYYVLASVAITF